MRRQGRGGVVGFLLLVLCGGCTRYTVQSFYDPGASFKNLRTFAWKPGPQPPIGDPRINDALIDASVRGAVDRDLAAKGYTKVPAADADFLLTYSAALDYKSSVMLIERSTHVGTDAWKGPRRIDTANFEEGTLVLSVFPRQSETPIWRGAAAGIFDPTATPDQRQERIAAALHKVLKEFPPD